MGISRMCDCWYYCRNRTFIRGGRVADGTVVWRIKDVRCPYSLGEFVFKMNEPKDYEYLLLCDGSTISEDNYPELVAVLGGTQLPNLIDRFLQGSATAGTYKAAGLPNIEGSISSIFNTSDSAGNAGTWDKETTGAFDESDFYTKANINLGPGTNVDTIGTIKLNASLSSSIYGKSATVQPPAFTTKIYICYAG